MKTNVNGEKPHILERILVAALLASAASPHLACAQEQPEPSRPPEESGNADAPDPLERGGATIYTPEDFTRFAPRNALDMLNQVPGFTINQQDQGRGLGSANQNVLLDGERLASKSDSVVDQLSRISASRVVRIEIVDGATLGIPGLSGQVANVITQAAGISGRFEYRAVARPHYARPSYGGGEVSVTGNIGNLEWTGSFAHGTGRGGAGGGPGTIIYDAAGEAIETRETLIWNKGEYPQFTGRLKWNGPNDLVANLSGQYGWDISRFRHDEWRHPVGGVGVYRDFLNRDDGYHYDISGDVDFEFGPGRLKLIGIDRFSQSDGPAISRLVFDDGRPDEGSRFWTDSRSGERIGRAEYRWGMLGGDWQIDAEAAFNRFDRIATLGFLGPDGEFDIEPLPGGTGGVTEDRYETVLTHGRSLSSNLTMQIGLGVEYSKLAQTGADGLTRRFWRPKGSASLAWTPTRGLDVSLKLERSVGQLSFGDFLARVDLAQGQDNAANQELVPPQEWSLDLELKKNLGKWGSTNLRLFYSGIDDYIDIIPVGDGLEATGNVEFAYSYGIEWTSTFELAPLGFEGAKIDSTVRLEKSQVDDPLTGEPRWFSNYNDRHVEISLRHDVPNSDWAWGGGFQYNHNQPYFRLYEIGREWEGPVYTFAFVEHKDVFGLTVNLNVFNMTGGGAFFRRTVYDGLRDRSPILFVEDRHNDVSTIYRLTVKGNF